MYETKKLYRSKRNRVVFGVCAGLADYYNVDVTLMRVGWIFASIVFSFPVFIYIVLFFAVPEESVKLGKDAREAELKDLTNNFTKRMQGFAYEVKNKKKAYNSKFDWVRIGITASILILVLKLFMPNEEVSSIIFVVGILTFIYYIAKNKNWIKNNVNFNLPNNKKNYYSNDIIRMQKNSQKDFPIREILFILFLVVLLLIYLINNNSWFAEQYVNIKEWIFGG